MFRVGLTGGIGSGKSVVAKVLRVLQVPVYEADVEGKRLLREDGSVRDAVHARFGSSVYPDGQFDNRALAAIVFRDKEALVALNAIIHPAVRRAFRSWCALQQVPYVVMEAAILIESGSHSAFERLVVVSAPEALRIRRVMDRDGSSEAQVKARMKNQATELERLEKADHEIVNDERHLVIPQVVMLHDELIRASAS